MNYLLTFLISGLWPAVYVIKFDILSHGWLRDLPIQVGNGQPWSRRFWCLIGRDVALHLWWLRHRNCCQSVHKWLTVGVSILYSISNDLLSNNLQSTAQLRMVINLLAVFYHTFLVNVFHAAHARENHIQDLCTLTELTWAALLPKLMFSKRRSLMKLVLCLNPLNGDLSTLSTSPLILPYLRSLIS